MNWLGCGCEGDHDENNLNCEYALTKTLLDDLPVELQERSLWWNTAKNKWTTLGARDKPMSRTRIGKAMQRINERCHISDRKLIGFMGRKTMATMGRHKFSFQNSIIQNTGNWTQEEQMEDYMDPAFYNVDREVLINKTFMELELGRYVSDIIDTVPHHLSELRKHSKWSKKTNSMMAHKVDVILVALNAIIKHMMRRA
jgi:hypothetical protein